MSTEGGRRNTFLKGSRERPVWLGHQRPRDQAQSADAQSEPEPLEGHWVLIGMKWQAMLHYEQRKNTSEFCNMLLLIFFQLK